jgi:hypothetical protein
MAERRDLEVVKDYVRSGGRGEEEDTFYDWMMMMMMMPKITKMFRNEKRQRRTYMW